MEIFILSFFYFDYNIKFNDGTEDWIDGKCLEKLEGEF